MSWFKEYKNSLKMIEVEEVLDLIFYRPLAFLFVKAIYPTNLTPNQISFIALAVGVIGGMLFSYGTHTASVAAAIMLILYDVLDCSDGQLARMKKNGTLTGRIVDGFSDYIVTIVAYIGIGFGLMHIWENTLFVWLLTAGAGISNAIHSIMLDYYRNMFMDNVLQRQSTLGESLQEFEQEYQKLKAKNSFSIELMLVWLYLRYSSIQIKFAPDSTRLYDAKLYYNNNKRILHLWTYIGPTTELTFMIVCAFFNRMDIYLWGIITLGNLYALLLYLMQTRINHTLKVV